MKPSELVKRAATATECSHYGLAKRLGLTEASVSRWANDKAWPDNNAVSLLAEAAGMDVWETICALEYERAEGEAKKSRWLGFLTAARARLQALAAIGFAAAALATHAPNTEAATPSSSGPSECRIIPEYVRRSRKFGGRTRHLWRVVRVLHRTRTRTPTPRRHVTRGRDNRAPVIGAPLRARCARVSITPNTQPTTPPPSRDGGGCCDRRN